jgi:hypothetical protein
MSERRIAYSLSVSGFGLFSRQSVYKALISNLGSLLGLEPKPSVLGTPALPASSKDIVNLNMGLWLNYKKTILSFFEISAVRGFFVPQA